MERNTCFVILLTLCISTTISKMTLAADGSLKQCQGYNKKIEYYTALRRNGGSAKSMENWKQKRNGYKERFSNRKCRKWGREINKNP